MQNNLKGKAKAAVLWSFFSQFSNQGLSFVIGLILARLLSPSDYGIIAMPMFFLSIAQCFINCGFGSALLRKPDLTEEDLSTAFYFNVVVGVVCYIILFFCSPLIADFFNVPILSDILKITALSTLFGPLQTVHYMLFSRNLDFKTPAKISITSTIVTGLVGIILALYGLGIWALVFQGVAGHLLSLSMVWSFSPWRPKAKWSNESFKYLFGFGSKILGSSILDTIYNNINPMIIGKFYSASDLGYYNKGMGYSTMPHDQVCGIIKSVSFPVLCQLQDDEQKLNDYFRKILRLIIFVLSPLELLLAALARPLVFLLITDKWEPCILILQIMCFAVVFWPIQSFNMSLFEVKGKSDLVLKSNTVIKILGVLIKLVSLPLGIIAICIGNLIHAVIAIAWTAYYAGKFTHFGICNQFREMASPFSLSLVMFLLVIFINSFIDPLYLQIIVGGTAGVLFYIGTAYYLKLSELEEVLFLLHIRKR